MKNKKNYIIVAFLLTAITFTTVTINKAMKPPSKKESIIKISAKNRNSRKPDSITDFYKDEITNKLLPVTNLDNSYNINTAIAENALVLTNNKYHNFNTYKDFISKVKKQKSAFLRIVFTTIEGDLIINDVKYDSKTNKTYVLSDNRKDRFGTPNITVDSYDNLLEKKGINGGEILIVYNDNQNDYLELLNFDTYSD